MSEFLSGNEWYWRLARTVVQGVCAFCAREVVRSTPFPCALAAHDFPTARRGYGPCLAMAAPRCWKVLGDRSCEEDLLSFIHQIRKWRGPFSEVAPPSECHSVTDALQVGLTWPATNSATNNPESSVFKR